MSRMLEQELPKGSEAPAMARDAIRLLEDEVKPELVDDATLLASELVTNSVKYGGEGNIRLEIEADSDRLRAEIIDQGSGFAHATREKRNLRASDAGGWGLELVEKLADDWGVHEGSTHVWFELRA